MLQSLILRCSCRALLPFTMVRRWSHTKVIPVTVNRALVHGRFYRKTGKLRLVATFTIAV